MIHSYNKAHRYKLFIILFIIPTFIKLNSQNVNITEKINYLVELNTNMSVGEVSPFWLSSNKYGLSSIEKNSGYLRGCIKQNLIHNNKWRLTYGIDIALPVNYSSDFIIHQLFSDIKYKRFLLEIGAKERLPELKNHLLSTGAQTLGINARPIPQIRLNIKDYLEIPYTKGFVHVKGHVAYGKMTDDRWQHSFTNRKSRFTDDVLFHSKAGVIKLGKNEGNVFAELGIEMATQFGGTTYQPNKDGTISVTNNSKDLNAFLDAFIPNTSGDPYEQKYKFKNAEGNHLGSWIARVTYNTKKWQGSIYADHYFEDHSSMFFLDYDGYGTNEKWNKKVKNKYLLYDLKDIMMGIELNLKTCNIIKDIVIEYIHSKYQSGPIYHDHNANTSDHIGGIDDYYNHYIYPGWQHWGQVIGNPLFLSPIYNKDHNINVKDNRFKAFHLGINGNITNLISYRLLVTYREGLGTYNKPYTNYKYQTNLLSEINYRFSGKKLKNWSIRSQFGLDFGKITGNNRGFNIIISKKGIIN